MQSTSYDDIVKGLYRAAAGAMPWHGALQALSDELGGDFCQMVLIDKTSGRMALSLHSTSAPMEGALDYMREYHRLDPHVALAGPLPTGQVFNNKIIPASQVRQDPFYKDFWASYNVRYMSGCKVDETPEWGAFFGLSRGPERGPFRATTDATLTRLMVHLREAFAIYRRFSKLSAQADSARVVIDQTTRPIFLLGPDRLLLHANACGTELLRRREIVLSRNGFLGCRDVGAESTMTRALYELELEGQPAGLADAKRPDRRAFALRDVQDNPVPACLWALRPMQTMAAFGDTPRALLMLPAALQDRQADPQVMAAGLT